MSSSDEGSVQEADFGPEGREGASVPQAGRGAPRGVDEGEGQGQGHGQGQGEGKSRSRGGLPEQQGPQSDTDSEGEVVEAGGEVFWGSAPGPMAHERAETLVFGPRIAVESAAIVEKLMNWQAERQAQEQARGKARGQARGYRRFRSSESCAAKLSAFWGNVEASPSGRVAQAPRGMEAQRVSAASSSHASGPERGRAWGSPKRGIKTRMMVSRAAPRSCSHQDLSDEFSEIQLIRGSLMTSAPRGLTTAMERQAAEELKVSFSKKIQCMVWGKGGTRPSYSGAAAPAGDLSRATAREKATPEKKSIGDSSRVALGRTFPSWGQRLKAASVEPDAFPPVSGISVLGRAKRYSLLPLGSKQSRYRGSGKRPMERERKEFQSVFKEDADPNQDGVPQAQLLTHSPRPTTRSLHHGELSSADPNTRAAQRPGTTHLLGQRQGAFRLRSHASSGDQEPTVQPPVPERQQQAPGAQGCPRCVELQKERDELKEQLAIMQALTKKFQGLGN